MPVGATQRTYFRQPQSGGGGFPDEGDLLARYDATELTGLSDGDAVSTWPDEVASADLSAVGGPTYKTGIKNGNPVVRYDGSDDGHNGDYASSNSQPNHFFAVFKFNRDKSEYNYVFGTDGTGRQDFYRTNGGSWGINAGSDVSGGTFDQNWHVASVLFDGASSMLRLDGADVISGDASTDSADTISAGYSENTGSNEGQVDVGEIAVYPQDKSGSQADIEQHLADKWGIALA